MNVDNLPMVSVIIIGANVEKTLARCFDAVKRLSYPEKKLEMTYVDSASMDQSVLIARRYGARVVRLQGPHMSPGMARNHGAMAANGEFIQFLDGDMEIFPNWLVTAIEIFKQPEIACVVGRCIENERNRGLYNVLVGLNWVRNPLGIVASPASGGLFRRSSLINAGLYNSFLKANEEPELGIRIRETGGVIMSIDAPMVTHDHPRNALTYIRRAVRGGYSRMQMILLSDIRKERGFTQKILFHDLQVLFVTILCFYALSVGYWRIYFYLFGAACIVIGRTAIKVKDELSPYHCILYAIDAHMSKCWSFLGQLKCLRDWALTPKQQ
jgi:glycosyltransferase involved in cell wall biosynthesis